MMVVVPYADLNLLDLAVELSITFCSLLCVRVDTFSVFSLKFSYSYSSASRNECGDHISMS